MARLTVVLLVGLALAWLAGCGGGGEGGAGPVVPPPDDGGSPAPVQVGPLLVRPAAAANFVAQEIPNPNGPVSFVALHGSRITYLASQAMLDRIVFSRGTGSDFDIWVCNLDGSNAVRLIDNAHSDDRPAWSPDGDQIVFDRTPSGQDAELVVMNADGSNPHALTANTDPDQHPCWTALGDQIVFQTNRTANFEIFATYLDGSSQVNLTNHPSHDQTPVCSPNEQNPFIVFNTSRDGSAEIYRMGPAGEFQTRLTNTPGPSFSPAFSPDGAEVVFAELPPGQGIDLWVTSVGALVSPHPFLQGPGADQAPSWSGDGRFIVFQSNADGDDELMLRETSAPFGVFQITSNGLEDTEPHLGSPTLQTDRVIIGPSGSDWGGTNPIWSSSDAGIAAWTADGYRNFVRIGIPANQLASLRVNPLATAANFIGGGTAPVGVVVEAADIVNLREDGGRGQTPVLWQLDPLDATGVLLYFDGSTGKLLSVLVLRDQNYPAGAGAVGSAVVQRVEGGAMIVEGAFAAVFDGDGVRLADAAEQVRIMGDAVAVMH